MKTAAEIADVINEYGHEIPIGRIQTLLCDCYQQALTDALSYIAEHDSGTFVKRNVINLRDSKTPEMF